MKAFLATTCILTGALLAGGCATKKYVRNTAAPIQAKVDQVGEQTTQNSQQIQNAQTQLKDVDERAQNGIGAAQEKAGAADQHANSADQHAATADQHATDAMSRAQQADGKADHAMTSLRSVVANMDDYKLQTSATVGFKFNQYKLTPEAMEDLDKLAQDVQADKRFFIAVEGFTDKTGSTDYNEALSRRRADSVVRYLVAKHDIPIYRIHMIGLGKDQPMETANTRAARAKNRRVEVKVFSGDGLSATLGGDASSADRSQQPSGPVIKDKN